MHDPFNPMQNQDPLDNQGLPDDPLLDALERSIENPPGFVDPLTENDESLMDDIAKQLDLIEAGTESTPPIPLLPGIVDDVNGPDVQDDESGNPEALESVDNLDGDDDEKHKLPSLLPPSLHDSLTGTTGPSQWPSKPPPGQQSDNRGRQEFAIKKHISRGGAGAGATTKRTSRCCPESHELIDEQKCESCEKYRHWPEGTDEEPKECWYDWQAKPPENEPADMD